MQAFLVRISSRLLRKTLGFTDERTKAESELLGAMDVVKCATWEVSFPALMLPFRAGLRTSGFRVFWVRPFPPA